MKKILLFISFVVIFISCNNTGPSDNFDSNHIEVEPIDRKTIQVNPLFSASGDSYYYLISNPNNGVLSDSDLRSFPTIVAWNQAGSEFRISNLDYNKTYRIYVSSSNPQYEGSEIHHRIFRLKL